MLQRLRSLMVLADQDMRKRFVIPQDNVEARLQLLDQVRFQKQGFRFARRDHEFHRPRQRDHPRDPLGLPADLRVVGNPRLEVPRLADIQQLARLAEHAIDARLARQPRDMIPDHIRPADPLPLRAIGRMQIHPGGNLLGLHLDVLLDLLFGQILLNLFDKAFGQIVRQVRRQVLRFFGIGRFHGGIGRRDRAQVQTICSADCRRLSPMLCQH